eukprot:gnl/Chilomastix_cuspidata/2778.p1 GENE.gnl/Chilomastix_cuspidata/2778~~gnl/Chilomastix_cuspidata/2778.p1  ORF type:complete len:365 (+),score=69.79 gnl/Chilomastix_cuspidata/2778:63-1157(+)
MQGSPRQLLVITDEAHQSVWRKIFKGAKLKDGIPVKVDCCSLDTLHIFVPPDKPPVFSIREGSRYRSLSPDMILCRSPVIAPKKKLWRQVTLGILYSHIPSVNTIGAELQYAERPRRIRALSELRDHLGPDRFPLIDVTFYPGADDVIVPPEMPFIAKVGPHQGGLGQIRVDSMDDLADLRSVMQLMNEYVTCEPLIEDATNIRLLYVGGHLRAWEDARAPDVAASFAAVEPVPERWALMLCETARATGLDLFALKLVRGTDGCEHIIDMSTGASPLCPSFLAEDRRRVRELVLRRMSGEPAPIPTPPPRPVPPTAPAPAPAPKPPSDAKRAPQTPAAVVWGVYGMSLLLLCSAAFLVGFGFRR